MYNPVVLFAFRQLQTDQPYEQLIQNPDFWRSAEGIMQQPGFTQNLVRQIRTTFSNPQIQGWLAREYQEVVLYRNGDSHRFYQLIQALSANNSELVDCFYSIIEGNVSTRREDDVFDDLLQRVAARTIAAKARAPISDEVIVQKLEQLGTNNRYAVIYFIDHVVDIVLKRGDELNSTVATTMARTIIRPDRPVMPENIAEANRCIMAATKIFIPGSTLCLTLGIARGSFRLIFSGIVFLLLGLALFAANIQFHLYTQGVMGEPIYDDLMRIITKIQQARIPR